MKILKQFYYDIKKKLGFSKIRPDFSKTHAEEKLELMEGRRREREVEFESSMLTKKTGRRVEMATKKTTKKKTTKKKTTKKATKKKACKKKTSTKKTTKKTTKKKATKKKTVKKKTTKKKTTKKK